MHESLRTRMQTDVAVIERTLGALRDAEASAPARSKLDDALDALDHHVAARKKQLA